MKYSKEQYAGMAEALRQAKRYLLTGNKAHRRWSGKTPYICFALSDAASAGDASWVHADFAKRVINRRLGRFPTVAHWLFARGVIDAVSPFTRDLQDYRHRWVDALIAEFEEKAQ